MFDYIFFDLDGTLTDPARIILRKMLMNYLNNSSAYLTVSMASLP